MESRIADLVGIHGFIRKFFIVWTLITGQHVQAGTPLNSSLDSLLQNKKACVGVSVISEGQEVYTLNGQIHFPLLSVYKFHQALAILDYLDKQKLPLETVIFVTKEDLLPNTYSPLRDARPEGGFSLSIGELLRYSVAHSDNNACDILFRYLGGTRLVEQYIRTLGINDFRITATEEEMHEAFANQYLNWTTPSAAAGLLEKFRREKLFKNPNYEEFLSEIMISTLTGRNKLKAGLPNGVILGHKTGSSDRDSTGLKVADNDIGFVCLPDGREYAIAVFVMDSREDDAMNAAIISEISRIIYEQLIVP